MKCEKCGDEVVGISVQSEARVHADGRRCVVPWGMAKQQAQAQQEAAQQAEGAQQ